MRRKLFLSVAVATLSLSLAPAYARSAGNPMNGAPAKQGEAATQKQESGGTKGQDSSARAKQDEAQSKRDAAQAERSEGAQTAREEAKSNRQETGKKRDQAQTKRSKDQIKREQAKSRDENRSTSQADEKQGAAETAADARTRQEQDAGKKGLDDSRRQDRWGRAAESERRANEADTGPTTQPGRAGQRAEDMRRQRQTDPALGRFGQPDGSTVGRGDADQTTRGATTARPGQARDSLGAVRPGQAPGGAQLSQRQQSQVREIISRSNAPTISRSDFDVRIGAVVPPTIQYQPLPPAVISMVPQYRGYDYVMVEDQIAIIDPGTRTVVTMLGDDGPPPAVYGYEEERGYYGGIGGAYERRDRDRGRYGSARREEGQYAGRREYRGERRGEAYGYAPRVRLDTRQERALYRGVMSESRSNLRQVCVRVGERVPDSVDIAPVPRNIVADAPDIERFEYFVLNDRVVLVDPDSRIVVDIIEEPR